MQFGGRQEGDKDYRTPINRQSIGEALRYLYNLSGKRLNPPEMEMDTVKTVHDIGAGGFSQYEIQYMQASVTPGASSVISSTIVAAQNVLGTGIVNSKQRSQDNIAGALVGPILQWETRVFGITGILSLDAAGAAAMATKKIDMYVIQDPIVGALGTTITLFHAASAGAIVGGVLSYRFNFLYGQQLSSQLAPAHQWAQWNKWVPARQRLTVQLVVQDLTNWAANTTCQVNAGAILVPEGVQLPT